MRRLTLTTRETAVNDSNTIVQEVIARRTGRSVKEFALGLQLVRDLRLHPLEVALVIVDIEDIVGVRVRLAEIGLIRTVGDLVSCVSHRLARTSGGELRLAQPAARRK
jgi:acyl carrier protein